VDAAGACPAASLTPTTYAYDGLDRQRAHGEGAGATAVHYDGLSSVASVETAPTTGVDTVYELSPHGTRKALVVETPVNPTTQYLTDDGHGDITTATDATGAVKCTARLDPFGGPIRGQSSANA